MSMPISPRQPATPSRVSGSVPDEVSGATLIAAERQRQIDDEGRTLEHDTEHTNQELAWAAVCYAAPETVYVVDYVARTGHIRTVCTEPWPRLWRRPDCDRVRQLVKAGALIAAEIDRLMRLSGGES